MRVIEYFKQLDKTGFLLLSASAFFGMLAYLFPTGEEQSQQIKNVLGLDVAGEYVFPAWFIPIYPIIMAFVVGLMTYMILDTIRTQRRIRKEWGLK